VSLETLPAFWHSAPRRWGHPLHSMSSYMAMFPPRIPHVFIRWLTNPGDVVYDPFSGRGTAPLEACLLGRLGFGSDANPLAWILTAARVQVPSRPAIEKRLQILRSEHGLESIGAAPDRIRVLFDPWTLGRLIFVRNQLDLRRAVDRFLMAVLLGGLHGNANRDGSVRGLTVPMPNTFAMSPGYLRKYIAVHGLGPPRIEPLDFIERRLGRLALRPPDYVSGRAWVQDARGPIRWPEGAPPAKLVFTSPPYMQVVKYGKYNWIRLWLLGFDAEDVDQRLVATSSLTRYLDFIRTSLVASAMHLREDGFLCLVLGDVVRPDGVLDLARRVAEEVVPDTGLHVGAIVADDVPVPHKVSRIWKDSRVRATKVERILILLGPAKPKLPPLPRVDWRRGWTLSRN
jgi:hypothetical protein